MTMYLSELILLITLIMCCDYWFFIRLKERSLNSLFLLLSFIPGIIFIITFLYIRFGFKYNHSYQFTSLLQWMFFIFVTIYISKIIYILFFYFNYLYNRFSNRKTKVIQKLGYAVSIFAIGIMGYGNLFTLNDIELVKKDISVQNLPASFEGFKIAVFADFHVGNWNNNFNIMKPLKETINNERPDIIVFAGDMVNNFAYELEDWKPYFKNNFHSKYGNFAVLGNHDYGDYTQWKNKKEQRENLENIKQNIREIGFTLLLNESLDIIKENDTITLVGVENYNKKKHFTNYCDLTKALKKTNYNRKKILLDHNPQHWDAEIVGKNDIFLTIAGHTHGGQIAIIDDEFDFSPIEILFKQWEGLYRKGEQYLYVNRGIGYVGIPLRLGVRPEVTILTLKKTL